MTLDARLADTDLAVHYTLIWPRVSLPWPILCTMEAFCRGGKPSKAAGLGEVLARPSS